MSDFLFTTEPQTENVLKEALERLGGSVQVYQGVWGTLAVTESKYPGFSPVETDEHICVVIGGPVLYFQDNSFIAGDDRQAGTRAILERWRGGQADWSEDLSGPFVILVIDKATSQVECITDLMMFIPVYQCQSNASVYWGTHVDAVALASGNQGAFDEASLVDFILHHAVTYPYTAYKPLRQCQPASIHRLKNHVSGGCKLFDPKAYWQPTEFNSFQSLSDAASYLRNGVQGYIDRVTGSLDHVAQFISAGEDSRAVAGMMPREKNRDAFIFLDSMNREGRIASKVAAAYGLNFNIGYRSLTHYLDILAESSELVGMGHQYVHAHAFKFHEELKLYEFRAVFGGLCSDTLLKSHFSSKPRWVTSFPFLPQVVKSKKSSLQSLPGRAYFSNKVIKKIEDRRVSHLELVRKMRPNSAIEWSRIWPATNYTDVPNLYVNRRLFASHEVFMAKESVKVSASVPTSWKLNRRLFNKAFKPALKPSRYIPHADGRLPYYAWWANSPLQFAIWFYRQVARRTGLNRKNEGPWNDWRAVLASKAWEDRVECFTNKMPVEELSQAKGQGALSGSNLSILSKVNFLQVCYQLQKNAEADIAFEAEEKALQKPLPSY